MNQILSNKVLAAAGALVLMLLLIGIELARGLDEVLGYAGGMWFPTYLLSSGLWMVGSILSVYQTHSHLQGRAESDD